MANKKNLAIIGFGGMGRYHSIMVRNSDVVNLLGTFDIDPERMALAREDGVGTYDSIEALLGDPRVDLVTIAIPNDGHKDMVIAALEAGKNVICEKPVALNSAQLEEMIAASKRTGKLFTVHQNRRWDPDKLAVEALFRSGEIGQIVSVESRVHGANGIPGDWRKIKEKGGGMLLDWGVHLIDQAVTINEGIPVESVYARFDHLYGDEVDDGCHVVLRFANGLVYTVEVGTCNYIILPRFYVRGTEGTAVIDDWDCPIRVTAKVKARDKDATPIRAGTGVTKTMAPRPEDTIRTYETPLPASDVHDFYRNVCAAIDGKAEQIVKHDQLRRVMKIMEAAFESGEKNEVIHRVI